MNKNKTLFALIICSSCLISNFSYADSKSKFEQVNILFKLTQMESKINNSIISIAQLQLRQNPDLIKNKDKLLHFLNKHVGWSAIKEDLAAMYMQSFTETELKMMNDFYITPTGQKVINLIPRLVEQRNQLSMRRLQDNIQELQDTIK